MAYDGAPMVPIEQAFVCKWLVEVKIKLFYFMIVAQNVVIVATAHLV